MSKTPELPEQLWALFQKGDVQAFEKIYRLYAPMLISYAKKLTNDEELIMDSMQDLFSRMWGRREELNMPQNVQAYLLSSIRREILKQSQKETQETHADNDIDVSQYVPSVEELLIQKHQHGEQSNMLINAVYHLPARQ